MTIEPDSNKKQNSVIVIDSLVRKDIIEELRNKGVKPEVKSIEPFQFKVSEEIGGFIKTFQEFYESIKQNNFLKNAELLRKQFLRPLFILEKDDTPDLDKNSVFTAWAKLFVRFNIPIILSRNTRNTVKLLLTIIRRESNDKVVRVATRMTKAPTELPEIQEHIIKGVPGISEELARRLLIKFKTLEHLVKATPEEYTEVKGIGKKLAEKLHLVFSSFYKSD